MNKNHIGLAIIALCNVIYYADRNLINILMEPMRRDLDLTDGQIGLVTGTAFALAYAGMVIPMGRLVDRYSRVRILTFTIVIWSAFTVVVGQARNYFSLLATRVGVAVGEAGGYVAMQSLVADLFSSATRSSAIAILMVGGVIGNMAAYGAAGYLNDLIGWRLTFTVFGAMGPLVALLIYFFIKEPKRGEADGLIVTEDANTEKSITAIKELLSRRAFMFLILSLAAATLSIYSINTWLPTFYIRRFNLDTGSAGGLMTIFAVLPMLLGTLVGGFISDRQFRKSPQLALYSPAILLLLSMPVLFAQLYAPSLNLALGACVAASFIAGTYTPVLVAFVQTLAGARLRGTATSLAAVAQMLVGQGLGPAIVGVLSDNITSHYGWQGGNYEALRIAMLLVSTGGVAGAGFMIAGSRHVSSSITRAKSYDTGIQI